MPHAVRSGLSGWPWPRATSGERSQVLPLALLETAAHVGPVPLRSDRFEELAFSLRYCSSRRAPRRRAPATDRRPADLRLVIVDLGRGQRGPAFPHQRRPADRHDGGRGLDSCFLNSSKLPKSRSRWLGQGPGRLPPALGARFARTGCAGRARNVEGRACESAPDMREVLLLGGPLQLREAAVGTSNVTLVMFIVCAHDCTGACGLERTVSY